MILVRFWESFGVRKVAIIEGFHMLRRYNYCMAHILVCYKYLLSWENFWEIVIFHLFMMLRIVQVNKTAAMTCARTVC